MKKSTIILLVFVFIILIAGMNGCSSYNSMVNGRESVRKEWQNVETFYQMRMDKIPNLVATVKGYAAHERTVLERVVELRNRCAANGARNSHEPDRRTAGRFCGLQRFAHRLVRDGTTIA